MQNKVDIHIHTMQTKPKQAEISKLVSLLRGENPFMRWNCPSVCLSVCPFVPAHYLSEGRFCGPNSDPFEVRFFWTKEVSWVRFEGWKQKLVGAAYQGVWFLYSGRITSKVGGLKSPSYGGEKSCWMCCCTKFCSRDIESGSWKFPKTVVL